MSEPRECEHDEPRNSALADRQLVILRTEAVWRSVRLEFREMVLDW